MNNEHLLISVVIPTFNVENFIEEAINSICNQTYRNIEIIVVDDNSTDFTYKKLKKLAETDSRIKLFKNDVNYKIAYTLNKAISLANGDYIVRMDGDDIALPNKIEFQLNYLLSNLDINLVGCHIFSINEDGILLNKIKTPTNWEQVSNLIELYSPVLHIWMCKKEVYLKLNGYRELSGSEDYDFLLRMDSLGLKFVNIDYYGYKVRLRNGNTQTTNGLRQYKIAKYCLKLYRERKFKTKDSFSIENLEKEINSNKIITYFHNRAIYLTYKAMTFKSEGKFFRAFLFVLIASFLSPYQFKLLLNKYKVNKILHD